MAYTGSVDLISGIRPKNNGSFPLVDAKDVYVTDDKRLDAALNDKADAAHTIPKPAEEGTTGQILRIDEEGKPAWSNVGTPTEEQVGDAVDAWLTAHPEATTTVQDGSITEAKLDDDLKGKTDAVPRLENTLDDIITDGDYMELTKESDAFTTEENTIANQFGKSTSAGYLLCSMIAPKDFDFYASGEILESDRPIIIAIYNDAIMAANYQAGQSYSRTTQGGTLPTENSKGHVYKDQIFTVSIYTPESNAGDFSIFANYIGYMLSNNTALNDRQIEQVTDEIIPDGVLSPEIDLAEAQKSQVLSDIVTDYQPFVLLNKESDVFTVVPDSYATTGNIVELAGYQLCYFTVENNCAVYFDSETLSGTYALFLSIYNTAIASGNNVVCYKRSDNNLPTESSKAQVSAGQIIAISIYTPSSSPADFGAYCNYEKHAVLNDGIRLNDAQIDQVLDELPSDFSGKMTNFADSKKIAWFGDSISELKSLPHITGSLMAADVYDCSIRGSTIGRTYSNYDEFSFYHLVTAVISGDFSAQFAQLDAYEQAQGRTYPGIRENLTTLSNLNFSTIDCVVLLQGTNDFGITAVHAAEGYATKVAEMQARMDDAISRFLAAYPHLKFYIISPPFRASPTEDYYGDTLADYIAAEKDVAEKYAIPFCNLLINSRICDQNKTTYMLSDGGVYVHPNDYGDAWLAELCAKFISVN